HGKLCESIEWRIDTVTSSSRGDKIQLPIVWLTLGYREGERRDRISLQLTPEAVQSLRRVCERISSS
ncbi:MAG: COMM domain-containing protein, partial [Polyangiaceae bacterium]|nr:COMM domain-containing protein [Polyangiaceae bacterium]